MFRRKAKNLGELFGWLQNSLWSCLPIVNWRPFLAQSSALDFQETVNDYYTSLRLSGCGGGGGGAVLTLHPQATPTVYRIGYKFPSCVSSTVLTSCCSGYFCCVFLKMCGFFTGGVPPVPGRGWHWLRVSSALSTNQLTDDVTPCQLTKHVKHDVTPVSWQVASRRSAGERRQIWRSAGQLTNDVTIWRNAQRNRVSPLVLPHQLYPVFALNSSSANLKRMRLTLLNEIKSNLAKTWCI